MTMVVSQQCGIAVLTLWQKLLNFYFPGVKLAIGPPIENGFYYDIDFDKHEISEKDLVKIEKKIIDLAREKNPFIRKEIKKKEAIKFFKAKNDPYKLELINELEDGTITFYNKGILLIYVEDLICQILVT